MKGGLRVLVLDDRPPDAELMERELRRARIAFTATRAATRAEFVAALDDFRPDLVLADDAVPTFDALSAMALLRAAHRDVPFIVVSGATGEEPAISMLRSGVTDYVHKDGLDRLGPAARRALGEARERSRLAATERALQQAREQFRSAFDDAPIGMAVVGVDGGVLRVNGELCRLLGRSEEDLLSKGGPVPILSTREKPPTSLTARVHRAEHRYLRPDGTILCLAVSTSLVVDPDAHPAHLIVQVEDRTASRDAEASLRDRALHDPLTGLPNRILLRDRLTHALQRSQRGVSRLAVLFIDLDQFKVVNDSLGHQAGDDLLVGVAGRLRSVLRSGDTAARFGGDEFVLVCEDLSHDDEAALIAQRIAQALTPGFDVAGHLIAVTCSIGIARPTDGHATADSLLGDADAAMYRAKEEGRARFEVFDGGMRRDAMDRLETTADLRRAIAEGELTIHYQPQVDLDTGELVGYEALTRWNHPARGLLHPADFIALAETTGLIVPLGTWALREACREAATWAGRCPGLIVAVNLSARQITDPGFVDTLSAILVETGIAPTALCLEITETALIAAPGLAARTLAEVRDLGVLVSIDDFGMGYASLGYLVDFHPSSLKVDRLFTGRLGSDPRSTAIVTAVVALAHSLGLVAIAEGVETPEQLELLRLIGCDQGQGYLFASPQRMEPAGELLGSRRHWEVAVDGAEVMGTADRTPLAFRPRLIVTARSPR